MSFQGPRGPNGLTAGFRLFIIQRHRRKKRPLGEEGETAEAERGQKGMDNRTSKQNYYLDIADSVLERSTCLRRKYGAIIVRNDEIISTGYNGAPMIGATIYLVGRDARTNELLSDAMSCSMCKRQIINAGIEKIVIRTSKTEYRTIPVSDWIENDDSIFML